MAVIRGDCSPRFIVAFKRGRGKSTIKIVGANVVQNRSGEQGAFRRSGCGGRGRLRGDAGMCTNLFTNLGGADVDVKAGKQVEGSELAVRVAKDVAEEGDFFLRKAYLRG